MLYSLGGTSWEPWAANHLIRFGFCLVMMLVLALVDLRVWFALAYPVYLGGLVLLVAVEVVGDTAWARSAGWTWASCASSRPRS